MKKLALLAGTIFIIFALVSCSGGGKYAAVKDLLEKQCDIMSNFADDINKATTAAEAAKAIDNFRESMEKIIPEVKDLDKKYPELKTQKEEDVPAELKPVLERLNKEIMPKFMSAFGKMQQFAGDPAVQEAQRKMNETMMKMR